MTYLPDAARVSAAALMVSLSLAGAPAPAQESAFTTPADFSQMVTEKLPSVVGILSTGPAPRVQPGPVPQLPPGLREFFGPQGPDTAPQGPMRSQGSGFVISEDGYIVTNNHVIAGAEKIEVVLADERQIDAELVGTDPATDIALLKVSVEGDLPDVAWGSSGDLQIGEWVVAIGNPFGLGGTVTAGIVSARSRDINAGPYDDFIQTDAAINRGNSGGPLFNDSGDVIGVNTAIFSPTGGSVGIGFAVPSDVAQRIVDDLRENGSVERGWLGVTLQPVDDGLANAVGLDEAQGVLISEVTADSPAAEAGLQPGDVILQVAGEDVADPRAISFAVADLAIGSEAIFTLFREGQQIEETVTIGQRPDMMAAAPTSPEMMDPGDSSGPKIGVAVAPVTPQLRAQLGLPPEVGGLVIQSVSTDSPAARANLRAGDVIVEASGEAITDVGALRDAVAQAVEDDKPLLLRVYRAGGYAFVPLNLDNERSGE